MNILIAFVAVAFVVTSIVRDHAANRLIKAQDELIDMQRLQIEALTVKAEFYNAVLKAIGERT